MRYTVLCTAFTVKSAIDFTHYKLQTFQKLLNSLHRQAFEMEGERNLGGRREGRNPPSFLARPTGFFRARNPLSLPFRTPATQATT